MLNKIKKMETKRIQSIGPVIKYRHSEYFGIFLYRCYLWMNFLT